MIDKERAEILAEARRLVRGGVSRRRLDQILKDRYGRSVGHEVHKRLFQNRVQEIDSRERKRPGGYRRPRTNQEQRYNQLRQAHFLPQEAREMAAKLNTLNIHEVRTMMNQREDLYRRYLRTAAVRGYTADEFRAGWRDYVSGWYMKNRPKWRIPFERWHKDRGHKVQRVRIPVDLWGWYGHVKSQLPPELQHDTPKKHRRKMQKLPKKDKIMVSKWINELQEKLKATRDPSEKVRIRQQIKNLQEGIR